MHCHLVLWAVNPITQASAIVLDKDGTIPYIDLKAEADLDKLKDLAAEITQYDKNYHNPKLLGPMFIDGEWIIIYHAPIPHQTQLNSYYVYHKIGPPLDGIYVPNSYEDIMSKVIGLR